MSYHVTILRTAGEQQVSISLDEAKTAISEIPGWEYLAGKDVAFVFSQAGKEIACLWYQDGELWAKNPEQEAIARMVALAEKLDARVRGDEYETYTSPTETYTHPDDAALVQSNAEESQRLERNSNVRHYLFRTYQIFITAWLTYFAIKWCIKNL